VSTNPGAEFSIKPNLKDKPCWCRHSRFVKDYKNDERSKNGFLAGARTLGGQLLPILELIDHEFGFDLGRISSSENNLSNFSLSLTLGLSSKSCMLIFIKPPRFL
jgi:hypothetical protein